MLLMFKAQFVSASASVVELCLTFSTLTLPSHPPAAHNEIWQPGVFVQRFVYLCEDPRVPSTQCHHG